MTNNQSLLERWARVVEKIHALDGPMPPDFLSLSTNYGFILRSDTMHYGHTNEWAKACMLAVLEKWLREDVAVWVEGETGPTILFPHMSGDSLRWMIAGVAQGRNDDTDLAHLELAEAICDYLETSK